MLETQKLFELYIPTSETLNQDIDLKDILQTIGNGKVASLTWLVAHLDWYGEDKFKAEVYRNWKHGVLISGKKLLNISQEVYQTIEGYFIGFPTLNSAKKVLEQGWWHSELFASTPIKLEIKADDNLGFVVYTPSQAEVERLTQHFQEVELREVDCTLQAITSQELETK
jgi:hypothetical protein